MIDPKMIAIYREFMKDKTDSEIKTIRYEMQVSSDHGSMVYFAAFLALGYQTKRVDAWAIYKCLYHETWIGDLKND